VHVQMYAKKVFLVPKKDLKMAKIHVYLERFFGVVFVKRNVVIRRIVERSSWKVRA